MQDLQSRRLGALAGLFAAVSALAGCDGPMHPPPPLPLTATLRNTDAAAVPVGQDATFVAVVNNPSTQAIQKLSILNRPNDDSLAIKSVTCVAQGATCPASGTDRVTLPAGGTLTFTVTATVVANPVTETITLDADGFAPMAQQAHALVANAADGAYLADVADGRDVSLQVDLTDPHAGLSQKIGEGLAMAPLVATADGSHATAGGLRFRTLDGLVIGTNDFGTGPLPFVGFRPNKYDLPNLDGLSFNTFERRRPAGGNAGTRAFATWFNGSTMTTCVDAVPDAPANCPDASQRHYAITHTVFGSFTATDASHGDVQQFMIGNAGTTIVLVRAEQLATGDVFTIALPATAGPATATLGGGSTRGDWDQLGLTAASYTARAIALDGTLGASVDQASLAAPTGALPGLVAGTRTSDGARLFIASSGPVAVAVGAPDGTANGEMHLYAQ